MKHNFLLYVFSLFTIFIKCYTEAATTIPKKNNNENSSIENKILCIERGYYAHSQCLTQIQQQILDNQKDIDLLRGKIQDNQYQLIQLAKKQNKIFDQINNMIKNKESLPTSNIKQYQPNIVINETKNLNKKNVNDNSVTSSYNEALALIFKKKQYDKAIVAFQKFLKKYPNSEYQANSYYWLGQLYYNKGKQDEALNYFSLITKQYPNSSKSSDALLKIGIILQDKKEKDKAQIIYHQITKLYPNSEAATQAKKYLNHS